ncbi:MAG: hypothetical protein JJU29_06195 [Verrucomicrobia bacterium]|nr:hypothetical protein [Verrucomicrobiota bacterium]MCH8511459.1 hypothetical protein [Kiritimatiellia bacterium]
MDKNAKIWFVQTEEKVFGPAALHTLQHWAATGGMTASTGVSQNENGPWSPAGDMQELALEWQVMTPDGETFDACHVLALREEVLNNQVEPFWDIVHLPTGETYQVVDALCSALLEQNQILEEQVAETLTRLHNLETIGPESLSSGDKTPSVTGDGDEDWGEVMRERDRLAREAEKWKRFYEDELERNQTREKELLAQIDELRAWQRKAAERIKSLERRRAQLEQATMLPGARDVTGEDQDLRHAYQELRVQLDQLMESLELRNRQIESARERIEEAEAHLRRERENRKEEVAREKALQEDAAAHLTRLEQAHVDLTRSYRDLNERMIRLRNQMEAPSKVSLSRESSEASPGEKRKAPPSAKPDDPSAPKSGKLKIKLT